MVDRFYGMLDCVDVAFITDHTLDELPTPAQIGATRVGGLDLNKPRTRAALSAVLTLAVAPEVFTAAQFTEQVRAITGQTAQDYTTRQGAYDLRKLRPKDLIVKPRRSRRYLVPPQAARAVATLLVLRDQVISPILVGIRSPRPGRKPAAWSHIDHDYESLRIDMQTLFGHLDLAAA